jgi:hypothetical protein
MTWLAASLASALALFQAQGPSRDHFWIADVKARRASFISKEVRIQGLVVDVRSTSLEGRRGIYRLIDESDPAGVLIRTASLPTDGGTYRVRGMLASQQPADSALLLVEVARQRTDKGSSIPLALAGLSAAGLLVFGMLAFRSARAERKYLVATPLWLLPEAGPYGKTVPGGATAPPISFDPELEEVDRRQRDLLQARRRRYSRALAGAGLALMVTGGWVVASRPTPAQVPAFVLIDAEEQVVAAGPARVDTLFADQPRVDTVLVVAPPPAPPSRAAAPSPRGTSPGSQRRDSARGGGDSVTATPSPPPASLPLPAPAPAPEPAPSPPPATPPPPPPISPEAERSRAREALAGGVDRIMAAINGRRTTDLLVLLPGQMAGDQGRLERFVELVKGFGPRATLGNVEPVSLAEGRGEARFAVSFIWRGDFGVERRKTGRFLGVARRTDDGGWRFEGARLLDAIP